VTGTADVSRSGARALGRLGRDEVARYGGRLAARARQALRQSGYPQGKDQVQDVVQEVYCRLLAGGGHRLTACRAAEEGQVVSYLGRVVERVVIDQGRRDRAAKRGGGSRGRIAGAEAWSLLHGQADPRGTPEDRLLAAERCRLFFKEWRDLGRESTGRRNLRILRLALIEGRSSREIAKILGELSPSGVDTVIYRLRRHLSGLGVAVPRRPSFPGGRPAI
jgi:DNA-directed RNA polymerase specialized sigma24 family protein